MSFPLKNQIRSDMVECFKEFFDTDHFDGEVVLFSLLFEGFEHSAHQQRDVRLFTDDVRGSTELRHRKDGAIFTDLNALNTGAELPRV